MNIPDRAWKKQLIAALVFLAAAPLLATVAMDLFVRQMLYPAPTVTVPSPPPSPLVEVSLETSEGDEVVGWLDGRAGASARGAPGSPGAPAVLFLHGNGENLATLHWSGLFDQFHRLGADVLAIDYPGYGRSAGRPNEAALVAAGVAGFNHLAREFPDRPIVVVGWSLGAAVAIQTVAVQTVVIQTAAAEPESPAGLVLLSPWYDLPSLAARFFPQPLVSLALRDAYHSADAAAELRRPVLVVHGIDDSIIPVQHGRDLYARLPEGSRLVQLQGVGHNDLMAQGETWRELADWLRDGPGGHGR